LSCWQSLGRKSRTQLLDPALGRRLATRDEPGARLATRNEPGTRLAPRDELGACLATRDEPGAAAVTGAGLAVSRAGAVVAGGMWPRGGTRCAHSQPLSNARSVVS
jgi:hypothetical protein